MFNVRQKSQRLVVEVGQVMITFLYALLCKMGETEGRNHETFICTEWWSVSRPGPGDQMPDNTSHQTAVSGKMVSQSLLTQKCLGWD